MGIKHEDVMAHGQKGLYSEWNKDHIIDDDVECNQHQHKEHVIENRTDWPAGPVKGQIIYRTDVNHFYIWNGATWVSYSNVATVIVAADGLGDYTDIQEGIDALPAGGGIVYVKEGTYTLTAFIDINKNNVTIIGAGKATKIITGLNIWLIIAQNKSGIQLEKLYLAGSGAGAATVDNIMLVGVTGSQIVNCWVEDADDIGIYLRGCSGINLSGVNVSNSGGFGIYMEHFGETRNSDITISDCSSNSNGSIGIFADESTCIIKGCHISDNFHSGIFLYEADDSVVNVNYVGENNTSSGVGQAGIVSSFTDDVVIGNNRVRENNLWQIDIGNGCNDNIVVANSCVSAAGGGIQDNGIGTELAHNKP